ncbi:MAG: M23 family metallopeptidase [Firmicutes bacterium]|nr:M23 family metallopeptidase [Bacillota bacterium]
MSEWTSDALARRWVKQTLAALALLVLLSTLHRGERLALIGSADHWLRQTVTQPYDFRAAAQLVQASPVWRAARLPEIVDRLRRSLAVTLVPPVPGTVVRTFGHAAGTEANNLFQGLELQTHPGTTVLAAAAGTVVSVEPDPAGHRLTLDHGGGLRTRCTFAGQVLVKAGDRLGRDAVLGKVDDSDGARVYFEVEVDGRAVDPSPFLLEEAGSV